jgi:ribosomal protein S18 acetylase RimI-like enzyme
MTDERLIGPANTADRAAIARTLALAFQNDPVFRWMVPNDDFRRRRLPMLFDVFFDIELGRGLILASADVEAVSFWRSAGKAVTPFGDFLLRAWPMITNFAPSLLRMLAVSGAIEAHLPKDRPFWYAHFVGVSPDAQRMGWGAALVRAGLDRARADGLPVYLETARPENVRFYQALGFRVTGEWDVPGGPHFWSMLHAASPS